MKGRLALSWLQHLGAWRPAPLGGRGKGGSGGRAPVRQHGPHASVFAYFNTVFSAVVLKTLVSHLCAGGGGGFGGAGFGGGDRFGGGGRCGHRAGVERQKGTCAQQASAALHS